MTKDTSGPAFPCQIHNKGDVEVKGFIGEPIAPSEVMIYEGVSVREYAAIKAMPVVLAEAWRNDWDFEGFDSFDQMVAHHACNIADALLAELEK